MCLGESDTKLSAYDTGHKLLQIRKYEEKLFLCNNSGSTEVNVHVCAV